jgi:hypothetical protein
MKMSLFRGPLPATRGGSGFSSVIDDQLTIFGGKHFCAKRSSVTLECPPKFDPHVRGTPKELISLLTKSDCHDAELRHKA